MFGLGILMTFVGMLGAAGLDGRFTRYPSLRTISVLVMLVGAVIYHGVFYSWSFRRARVPEAVPRNSPSTFWLRLVTTILWLGVLPLVCLWVYHQLSEQH